MTERQTSGLRRRLRRGDRSDDLGVIERREAPARRDVDPPARARSESADPPLDRATYSCTCGYVFAAPVTTTVACPNCGDAQAW